MIIMNGAEVSSHAVRNDMPQQTPRSWTNCSISSHCPVQNPFFSFEKGDKLCNIEQILHHMVALRIWQSQQTIPARPILQLLRPLWLQYGSLRPRVSCPAGIDHACQGELPRSLWPLFSPHTAVISKSYSPIQPDVSESPPYAPWPITRQPFSLWEKAKCPPYDIF